MSILDFAILSDVKYKTHKTACFIWLNTAANGKNNILLIYIYGLLMNSESSKEV
jgi:hypothetical protein